MVDLRSARVHTLVDDQPSWPERLDLRNFHYEEIANVAPIEAQPRLDWLDRQVADRTTIPNPQPYRQLAAVLSRQGHDEEARRVMIRYHWRRMLRAPKFHWRHRQWAAALGSTAMLVPRFFFGTIAGFGYARWRALVWLLAIFIAGAIIFGWNGGAYMKESQAYALRSRAALSAIDAQLAKLEAQGQSGIKEAEVLRSQRNEHEWVERYPGFNAWVYSLDALIPVFDLHQESYWTPKDGWVRWGYLPAHVAAGWIVATLFVVSLTGLVRRTGDD